MLFIQNQYLYLAQNFLTCEHVLVQQFANQEYLLQLPSAVTEQKCTVIGSLTAPADQVLSLLLLLDALVRQGASSVILYSPYLGYQRQDSCKQGQSQGLLWADAMISAMKITSVVTIEPHCNDYLSQLKTPFIIQSSELIFIQDIAYFVSAGFTFVFPDAGSVERSSWLIDNFPMVSCGFFLKKRKFDLIELQSFQGKVSHKVILYDDILDSGETLLQACIALKQMHVQEIVIFVTHAFFQGSAWNDLWNLGVKFLYCSNSTYQSDQIQHPSIRVKSIMPLLQKIV